MTQPSKAARWAGRILAGLIVLFLLADGAAKIARVPEVLDASEKLGIPADTVRPIGAVLVASALIYAVPATAVLGAVLLTGYLGGAILTHVRAGGDVFPVVFCTVFGVLVWLSLVLREPRLRALLPLRTAVR